MRIHILVSFIMLSIPTVYSMDSISSDNRDRLILAIMSNDPDLFDKSFARVPSTDLGQCLHQAALSGSDRIVAHVLAKDSSIIDTIDDEGTALHAAIRARSVPVVRVLLEHNPRLDISDHKGLTVKQLAEKKTWAPGMEYAVRSGNRDKEPAFQIFDLIVRAELDNLSDE